MDKAEVQKLYNDFQNRFPIERLINLPIEEYTNLNRDNSFCYWLETKTESLGSIWGGSAYKFGIYKASGEIKPSNKTLNDGEYAWYKKYGSTRDEAYKTILTNIIKVAEAAHNKNFTLIDTIDLGISYKWKIAKIYKKILCVNGELFSCANCRPAVFFFQVFLGAKSVQAQSAFVFLSETVLKTLYWCKALNS